ncbi:MAG: NUDIX hydrolase [Planctomycetota bacterium]|jgi:ADP-ribose pyrophosphatase YjhB (NUDIX family)
MSLIKDWNFCPRCGKELARAFDGERDVPQCAKCGRFYYDNPVPCVTALLETGEGILLILRGKNPKAGWWALPGGFLDIGETPEEGAMREFAEETGLEPLKAELIGIASQHSARFGSVLYAGYRIVEYSGELRPGSDADEARFFPRDEMPDIAFDSLKAILKLYLEQHPKPPAPSK